jgi:hypothetical protein
MKAAVANASSTRMPRLQPEIVGWCPDDEFYIKPYTVGERCPGEECPNILRKRAMYICYIEGHDCDERGFFKRSELEEHQKVDAEI